MFAGGSAPSFTFGSPAPGDDSKSLIFSEASQSVGFDTPKVGARVDATLEFIMEGGPPVTGRFPPTAAIGEVVTTVAGSKLIYLRFPGALNSEAFFGTPTRLSAVLPAALAAPPAETVVGTGFVDGAASQFVHCIVHGNTISFDSDTSYTGAGAHNLFPFVVTYFGL